MSFNEGYGFNFGDEFDEDIEQEVGLIELELESPDEMIDAYFEKIIEARRADEVYGLLLGLFSYAERYGVRECLFEQIQEFTKGFGILSSYDQE